MQGYDRVKLSDFDGLICGNKRSWWTRLFPLAK